MTLLDPFRNLSWTEKLVLIGALCGAGGALAYWVYFQRSKASIQGADPPLKLKRKVKRENREVIVVSHRSDWTRAYSYVLAALEECKVLGFDCEWVTEKNKPKPVALIQLSTQHGVCVLFRACMFPRCIPKSFIELLENKSIIKIGVGSVEDGKKLNKDYGISVRGCVDLRNLVVRQGKKYLGGLGLRDIAHDVLDVDLQKSPALRCGDWEARELTEEQVKYAADDAVVAMDIFTSIVANKLSKAASVDRLLEYYACPYADDLEEDVADDAIEEFNKKAMSLCQGVVDVNFTQLTAGFKRVRSLFFATLAAIFR